MQRALLLQGWCLHQQKWYLLMVGAHIKIVLPIMNIFEHDGSSDQVELNLFAMYNE